MKKFFLSVLAVAALFTACTTEATQDVPSVTVPDVLTVSFEADDSRVQLMDDKTVWTAGDEVAVFYKSNAISTFEFQGKTGDRNGELKLVNKAVGPVQMEKVVAVYPYSANYLVTPSTGAIEATLPAEQTYLEGSYGLGSSMMISSGYFTQVMFKNVMGWVKFQLTGEEQAITKIVFRGNNGEQVAGLVYVDADDAYLTLSSTPAEEGEAASGNLTFEGSNVAEVSLVCETPVVLSSEPTSFYLALPPQEFTNGFTVEIWGQDANGNELKMVKKSEAALTIERNVIQPLEAVAYEGKPTSLTAAFTRVEQFMDLSQQGLAGWYYLIVANDNYDMASLLFYDNTNPFVALNGEYSAFSGSFDMGPHPEVPALMADPGYTNFNIGGTQYYPVSGTVTVFSTLAQGAPEDNNGLEFNMVVMDDAGNELTLTGDIESNIVGAFGYGPSYIDFNLAEWGFNTFEVSYDENSANIVKLTSTTTSGDFVMELSTENGDITEGAYRVMMGTLSGYYFDGLDAQEYVFQDGQISFEKVEGVENGYMLNISSRAGDWVLGNKYKVAVPEEGGYPVTINIPAAAPTSLTAAFTRVEQFMDLSQQGLAGWYYLIVANDNYDMASLLFYDNTNPFVALNGEYSAFSGSFDMGPHPEVPALMADPGYTNFNIGGTQYYPVSGTVTVFSTLAQGAPEDNNGLEFNMVVMDDAGNELTLTGDIESNIVGAFGYGPSYIDFNLAEWGFNTFEVSYDENSANIVKLTSATTSGDFVMELSTENGDITEGAYRVMMGTLSGYYFDGLDAQEYVFQDGQISFEKVEGVENGYMLNISSRAGDWVLGNKYKVAVPEEGGYPVTINFPAAAPTALTAAFTRVEQFMDLSQQGLAGWYYLIVANDNYDMASLLFYDNTNPFVALNGEYSAFSGSFDMGPHPEVPALMADPGYTNFNIGGTLYFPVSGTVNVYSALAQGSPEDNNALEFNMVVMDDAGNELTLTGDIESNIVGAFGYGPSYIDFNLAEWGFNTFEVSYDENSANIVKLTSTTTSGDFVMELSTENGDITEGAYRVMMGTLSGYYFDGLDAQEYVFQDGQISFEKVEGVENGYMLNISSRAGDWVLGNKYKVAVPEEGGYPVTINFPAPEEPEVSEPSVNLALAGSFSEWADLPMEYSNGIYFVKGFDLDAYAKFKIKTVGTWDDVNVGASTVNYLNPGNHIAVVNDSNSGDIAITEAGTYDIYFDLANLKLYVVAADADYTSAPLQTENGPEPPVVEPEVTENVLYLKPNSNWNQANARFAAYFFNASGNTWVSATDSDADGIYEVYIPTGYVAGENVIFCRMNPSTTANDWNNKWNQTGDLVIPTDDKNLYTVADGTWDNGNGTWSVK